MRRLRVNQAINVAIADAMSEDDTVILMGEDVGAAGGVFKVSEDLQRRFGDHRVLDTPISEMGFLGAGVGAAATGLRPVVEIMFLEFLGVALDQLVTQAAKLRYLSGGALRVPLTVRASIGPGSGFGAQHSQTLEHWFTATPGLRTVVVSDAQSAYWLTRQAISDDDPTLVLEPRVLYGRRLALSDDPEGVRLGRARVVRPGRDVTVVTLGQTLGIALDAASESHHDVEVIDLSSAYPIDYQTVLESVSRTRHLITVEDGPYEGGWGADVVAKVSTELFGLLAAPCARLTAPNTPIPFAADLESLIVPSAQDVRDTATALRDGTTIPRPWWWELERAESA